jgi:hypothetical protein
MAFAVRTPPVSTTALAVGDVNVLGVMAARDAGDPAVWDVGAGDRVPPAGLLLIGSQVRHLPAGRLCSAGDPAQPAGPLAGPGHQAGDLGDVLVLLDGAVLPGARLPRELRDAHDRRLVGAGDHPAAGEQDLPARGGHAQQVIDELVARARAVNADQDLAPEPGRDLAQGRGQHIPVIGERVVG